jgi:hypothetical protein
MQIYIYVNFDQKIDFLDGLIKSRSKFIEYLWSFSLSIGYQISFHFDMYKGRMKEKSFQIIIETNK